MTTVVFPGECWHVIEYVDVLLKRWQRAYSRGELMRMRYAGANYTVNPFQVIYMEGRRR